MLVGHYRLVMTCPKYLHKSVYISPKNKTVDTPKYFLSSYLKQRGSTPKFAYIKNSIFQVQVMATRSWIKGIQVLRYVKYIGIVNSTRL